MPALVKTLISLSLALVLPLGANSAALEKRQPTLVGAPSVLGKGRYPRAAYVNDGVLLACFIERANSRKTIRVVRSDDDGVTWRSWSSILDVQANTHALDNCFLHQLPNRGSILLAFRDNVKGPDNRYKSNTMFLYGSDNGGQRWDLRSIVDQNTVHGNGMYEPFLFDGADGSLHLYYTRETRTDYSDQDNYVKRSSDGGRTWGPLQTVTGNDRNARDGTTGVVRLVSGKLLLVFESLGSRISDGITLMSSIDDGKTWRNRRILYQAPKGKTVNAPCIAKVGSTLVLTFYSTEEHPGSSDIRLLTSTDSGVTWGGRTNVCDACELAGQVAVDDNTFIVFANQLPGDGTSEVRAYRMRV
jgi:hypothetical protein